MMNGVGGKAGELGPREIASPGQGAAATGSRHCIARLFLVLLSHHHRDDVADSTPLYSFQHMNLLLLISHFTHFLSTTRVC